MKVRPAAVAGLFYPDDANELSAMVRDFLQAAPEPTYHAKAIIAPHAGHIYSGPTAAFAYKALDAGKVERVVLFGPSHRVAFQGMALPDADVFETPLGRIPLDQEAMQLSLSQPWVNVNAAAHAMEHSLEVHLPFLQTVLGKFRLVPLCVGMATPSQVASVIDALWDGDETAIVISSDLSHYHSYDEARLLDQATVRDILDNAGPLNHEQACGATPINGLLELAVGRHLEASLLDYRNSGDTAGDRERVVGYTSIAFHER